MARYLQWMSAIERTQVPLPAHAKAAATLMVTRDPEGDDQIVGAVENSAVKIGLVLPDGRRLDETETGKYGIRVERKHHEGPHTLTLFSDPFPDLDVVSFAIPPNLGNGEYLIEANALEYGKDSLLIGARVPTLREHSDELTVAAELSVVEDARGCPDDDVTLAVVALCGDEFCSALSTTGVATRLDSGRRGEEYRSRIQPSNESTHRTKENQAIQGVNFQRIPPGEYDIATTVQATFPNGQRKTRQQHTRLTIPKASAEITNARVLSPHQSVPGEPETKEIAMDVKAFEPGDYKLMLVLYSEAGSSLSFTSLPQFLDTDVHQMTVSLPEGTRPGSYVILHSRLDRLQQDGRKAVCAAYQGKSVSLVVQ